MTSIKIMIGGVVMKDLPHHIKKLNRNVIRSVHRLEKEEEDYEELLPSPPSRVPPSKEAKRKHVKQEMRAEREAHIPTHPTEEERNQKMKHRVPQIERNDAPPKHAKQSKKKRPKI